MRYRDTLWRKKKEQSMQEVWDYIKCNNMGNQNTRRRENKAGEIFEEILQKKFPNK